MLGSLFSFALALLIGMAIVTLLWPGRRLRENLLTKLSLAGGLGLGAISCLSFLYLAASGGRLGWLPVAEILLLAGLLSCVLFRHPREEAGLVHQREAGPWSVAAPLAALAVFLVGTASFARTCADWPDGGWDAWSIWNLHARFLYQGGEHWNDFFSGPLDWSHPDYPLMLPLSVMRTWVFAGGETGAGPILIAFVFMGATCLLLFSSLSLLRGTLRAGLAVILLASTPWFITNAALQYAEIPLGFFYLATLVLLCLADREAKGRPGLLMMAGLACGLAAWTKNEGLLFMFCVLLARIWTSARRSDAGAWRRRIWPFLVGLLPVLLVILFFKARFAPTNDFIRSLGRGAALGRFLTVSRYVTIGKWLLQQLSAFGRWDTLPLIPVSPVPVLLGALILVGTEREARQAQGPITAAWTLGLTLAGYLLILLLTPNPLEWQLAAAGERLLMQLWPSALFVFFVMIRDPFSARPESLFRDSPRRGNAGGGSRPKPIAHPGAAAGG